MEQLIIGPRWNIANQAGCCGIATVSRLNARYCTPAARDANLKAWYETVRPYAIMSDLPKWAARSMLHILKYSDQRPQGVRWGGRQNFAGWYGNAQPSTIGFIALLEAMKQTNKACIYFLSDNVERSGDVHLGPFSTLYFVQWLFAMNLGNLQTTGPITSLRTSRNIQGWMFTPNWRTIDNLIESGRGELIASIKELNNDKRIKEASQERIKQANIEARAMRQSLSSGW